MVERIHKDRFAVPKLPWHTNDKPFGWSQEEWDEWLKEFEMWLYDEEEWWNNHYYMED
jgi:hypothetical protein